jgi:diguanylate cyclase (GGDEF)-like protein
MRRWFPKFAGCVLLIWATVMHAQRNAFHSYGQSDGLENLNIRCLLQDHKGLLWVCTEGGLFRYDGSDFTSVPLVGTELDSYITGIAQDTADRIWVATPHELFVHDALGMHVVSSPGEEFELDVHANLATAPDDPGSLYFVSRHKLMVVRPGKDKKWQVSSFFDATQLALYPALQKISALYIINRNQFWFGCGSGICSFLNGTIHYYGYEAGLPSGRWITIFLDREKRIWVRSEHELFYLAPGSSRFTSCPPGLPGYSLGVRDPAMVDDSQGRMLVNVTGGLARLENNHWEILKERTDLPPHPISGLLVDQQGSIWMGLQGHGLARWLGYGDWENWTALNGLSSEMVWSFLRDKQDFLWVATQSDLDRLQKNGETLQPQMDSLGNPMRRAETLTLASDGHLWSGSDDGRVVDYDPNTRIARLVGKLNNVFHVRADSTGHVWICSINGLYVADAAHPEHGITLVSDPRAPSGPVYQSAQDSKKDLWFIADSGLFRFAKNEWHHIQLPKEYQPLLSAQITIAPDNTIWISGSFPLLTHLKIHGDQSDEIESIDAQGLQSNVVYFVVPDRRGWLWVGTNSGIAVFNGKQWQHLSMEDGLVWNDTNSNAFFEDKDGSIWIGTSGGVSHLLHPEKCFHSDPLVVWVGAAKIGDTVLSSHNATQVPWGHRPLDVHISSLDFIRQHLITFHYRLEGLEEDWQSTSLNEIRYPPLPPGNYRLAIIAADAGNGRRSAPVSIAFTILPPWWRTQWILAAEITAILLLLLLAWRWSIRFLVSQKNRLEELVKQRTIELEKEKAELLKARAALEEQASHDSLTGLLNRSAIFSQLTLEVERAEREDRPLAIVLADLDYFKSINDTYGHLAGDRVLQEYAEHLRSVVRPYDLVGRYGGEEFLLIFPGLPQEDGDIRVADIHRRAFERPFQFNEHEFQVTCSFGVAWYIAGRDNVESLIERADHALYVAKNNGRNRMEVYYEPSESEF